MIKKIKKQMILVLLLSLSAYVLAACGHTAESRSAGEGLSDVIYASAGVPAETIMASYEAEPADSEEPEEIEVIEEETEAEEPEKEIIEDTPAPTKEPVVEAPAPEPVADPEPIVEETVAEEPAPAPEQPAQPASGGKLKAPESALLRRTGHGFHYGYSFGADCDTWYYDLAFSTCTGPDDSAINSGMPLYPQMWMEAHGITDVDEMWTYWINNIRPTYYGCWDRQGSSGAWQIENLGAMNGDVGFSPDLVVNGPICW